MLKLKLLTNATPNMLHFYQICNLSLFKRDVNIVYKRSIKNSIVKLF